MGGLEAAGIGRSKGGLTTKIHAAVDALGLPIRTIITPGQWGDSPQARGLIDGLTAAQRVIMDAAYDADHLRTFIADDLGATAHIKRNPTRREGRYIDWALYKERHLVELASGKQSTGLFSDPPHFNRIKRFRRIALRCEKTISSFKAFVDLACAMAWIS